VCDVENEQNGSYAEKVCAKTEKGEREDGERK